MREYLDRVIDELHEDKPVKDTLSKKEENELKLYVGKNYIELRGICKQNGIWFEDAVGYAYHKLKD